MNGEAVKALTSSDISNRFATIGASAIADTPEQFAVTIKSDIARWAKVVKAANLKIE